ncbi:putative bifunctional diguanylate cyclase/phosphodiesterase [Tritonibacter litoralis]|nr:EAL domain-containing protein [Tritonibacter litoralis]
MAAKALFARTAGTQVMIKRFWGLLLLVLVLAVTSSAIAVRMTATPFLMREEYEAINAQAKADMLALEAKLERYKAILDILSYAPPVHGVATGAQNQGEALQALMQQLEPSDTVSWVRIYDQGGRLISHTSFAETPMDPALEPSLDILVARTNHADQAKAQDLVLSFSPQGFGLALAAPIHEGGQTHGAVVAALDIEYAAVLTPHETIQETFVVSDGTAELPEHAISYPLSSWDLTLVSIPDTEAVADAGRQLVTSTISVLFVVLLVAFMLFAALGRAALVEPHRRLERQKKSLSELAAVAKRANDAFLVTDADGCIVWTNPAFEKLSGFTGMEARGQKPGDILQGPDTDPDTVSEIREALRLRRPIKTEILNYKKTGEPFWVSLGISPLRNEDSKFYGFMAISHDVTQERAQREAILAAKKEIEHQALHDSLTGLPNRRALDIALSARGDQAGSDATVVRIDLDHFKYVNDTLGHAAGDFVLCDVADILREETKSEDLPARVGGDEFVILLSAGKSSEDGRVVAERMLKRIKQPKQFDKKTIRVGASFGVASTLDGLLPLDDLIVGADAALYEAKDSGRNTVRLYTPQLHHTVQGRRSLALEIRRAIVNEEFTPFYQPQFDAKTHEIVGVETLVRWQSPELGLMTPNVFLPIADQLSAVDEIDALIFRKATQEISALRKQGVIIPKLSFNVTADRIQNPDMFLDLPKQSETGYQIAFEVLESVLVEEQSDLFNFSVDRLRDMGISIEIDDFGSGHASIVGLMHLQPDVMKIDQQLVLPLTKSDTIRGLLKQIVGMADLMGLKVTAEGVETWEHARILTDLGCDTLQGFAFARPQSGRDLFHFAQNWSAEQSLRHSSK